MSRQASRDFRKDSMRYLLIVLLLFAACSHHVPMPDRDTIGGAEVGGVVR